VLTPVETSTTDPNRVGGRQVDQNFLFHPAFGWSLWRTQIGHLCMVGASIWPTLVSAPVLAPFLGTALRAAKV